MLEESGDRVRVQRDVNDVADVASTDEAHDHRGPELRCQRMDLPVVARASEVENLRPGPQARLNDSRLIGFSGHDNAIGRQRLNHGNQGADLVGSTHPARLCRARLSTDVDKVGPLRRHHASLADGGLG